MKRKRQPNSFRSYNEYFTYEKSTWSVIHKLDDLLYAVEINKSGKAGGGVMRFRDGLMVEK